MRVLYDLSLSWLVVFSMCAQLLSVPILFLVSKELWVGRHGEGFP
jgi:hypothetical protein